MICLAPFTKQSSLSSRSQLVRILYRKIILTLLYLCILSNVKQRYLISQHVTCGNFPASCMYRSIMSHQKAVKSNLHHWRKTFASTTSQFPERFSAALLWRVSRDAFSRHFLLMENVRKPFRYQTPYAILSTYMHSSLSCGTLVSLKFSETNFCCALMPSRFSCFALRVQIIDANNQLFL